MTIICINSNEHGIHAIESQSHRTYPDNWNGEGWLPVPPELESKIKKYWPYLDITLNEDGTEIIDIVETERPPEPEPEPIETLDDRVTDLETEVSDISIAIERGLTL